MNTKYANSIFDRPIYILVILAVTLLVTLGVTTWRAAAQEPGPVIRISTSNNYLRADYFIPGATVTFTVYESEGSSNVVLEISRVADGDGHVFIDGGEHAADLVPGNFVVASDGSNEKQILLEPLTIEVYDPDTNIVAGTASAYRSVWVVIGNNTDGYPAGMDANADEAGAWSVDFTGVWDFHTDMWGSAIVYDDDGDETVYHKGSHLPGAWRDEFDGALDDSWYWIDENPEKWNLADQPGFLRIYASPYEEYGGRNLLLRPVAQGDFAIETRVFFEPDANFQFAGLVIYQDEDNFLQFGRAFCDIEGTCVGNGIYFDKVLEGGFTDGNFATQFDNPFDPAESYLRLERRGDMVKAFYSHEGITWTEIGTHWIPPDFQVNGVGLVAAGDLDKSDEDIPADFDFFELTEGWGFLPEGFHDYDSGIVPSSACNAGGWAVDPDDRDADIMVEINVDGGAYQNVISASEYRPDLEETGQCVGGSCGFFTSLWGQVSSYEDHLVVAYAQDIPSGKWVHLSSSPKPLTCRTYDIYAYDPLTGETSQITDLRDTDEYNPGWSPNGKKVAYDVVSLDGPQVGIYITDLNTGNTLPLTGAENGNDAVWSPNGRWIAFDRDSNLYIVPSEGGTAKLVKGDAVSANWAPNGKRLVFQQPSDGSIRTVAIDGGKGRSMLIAASGANPSWSPDGSWIAYEYNGDVWKVPVNVQGIVLGDPIQVTSLAAGEGQPTWSADSQSIVYHAGLSRDYDLWSVPSAGGEPTWLTGAPEFGDYDPEYAQDSSNIAYASFSPDGQAARHWSSTFTQDLPADSWTPGDHSYYFENTFTFPEPGGGPTDPINFSVSEGVEAYDGYALLRPFAIQAHAWGECRYIDAINPFHATRFLYGWVTDDLLTYQEAVAHFDSMAITAYWDGGLSVNLSQRHEIFPRTSEVDLFGYRCSFTEPPPLIKVQITDNWFEAQRFLPFTELTYQIYESPGGSLLLEGVMGSDDSGTAGIWVGNVVDLVPGHYIVVSDGYSTKNILLESITFDLINTETGHAEGTAPEPFGRTIWVGIGFPDAGWDRWVPTGGDGHWTAEFEQPIPANFDWIAAWAFDTDGDISEVRPEVIQLKMDLRVNYGHDWVESFYEAGHEVVITVTEGDGQTVKATATVTTEPKDFWGGATGFQTTPEDWSPGQPDLQPYDWVYAQVDNGVTALVQLGDISGGINLDTDSIQGTINAPWFSDEVGVECHPWGSPNPVDMKFDAAFTDGADLYSCSWDPATEWDIQYYQDVGVGYFGPDGHWVANAFFIRNPHFTVFPEWEFFDGLEWPDGANVLITVEGKDVCTITKESWGYFFNGNFEEGCDLEIGDTVTFTDGTTTRTHLVQYLAITDINKDENTITGIAGDGALVYVWPHDAWFGPLEATADQFGVWQVDLDNAGYDIQEGASGRSEIRDEFGNATAVDWYVPKPRFTIYPDAQWFDGIDWPDGDVTITVVDKCSFTRQSAGGFFNGSFPEGCVVTAGDTVNFEYGDIIRTHTVRSLAIKIIDKEANTLTGEADSGEQIFVWAWYMDGTPVEGSNTDVTAVAGAWLVDYDDLGVDLALGMGIQAEIRDAEGNATSVDLPVPDPRIVASITENWFYLADFIPGETLDLSIYDYQGGTQLWNDSLHSTDVNGFAWINFEEHRVDLVPGSYLVVSDGNTTKDLVVEEFTFDLFDLASGLLQGTAPEPFGRRVWVGIGWENDSWSMDVIADEVGFWVADYGGPVPGGYLWVAAQIFDADGDASELRPAEIIGLP